MTKTRWQLLGVMLVAFILRIVNLNGRPMWYDESFAVLYAEKSFAQMWYGTTTLVQGAAADVHPLFYYTLLHSWMDLVGQSAFAVRFFSLLASVATVAVVYRLALVLQSPATRHSSPVTRQQTPISNLQSPISIPLSLHPSISPSLSQALPLIASLIVAAAPFAIAYGQETRMYGLLGFTGALTILAHVQIDRGHGRAWWLVLVLSAAAMLYSHNLAVFFGAALGLWILIQTIRRRAWRQLATYAAAGVAILFLWLPWLTLLPSQLGKIQQAYWISTPDGLTVLQTLLTFTVDFDNSKLPPLLIPFALVGVVLLIVLLFVELVRGGWRDAHVGFLVTLAVLPPVLIFVVSLWRPVYLTRALMPSFLMLVLLVAWLLTRLPKIFGVGVGIALAALAALSLSFYYPYAEIPRPPFQAALNFLYQSQQPSDTIVHDNKMSYFPMYYYARTNPLPQHFIQDPPGAGSDTLAYPTQESLNLFAEPLDTAVANRGRIWFVMFREARDESATAVNLDALRALYGEPQTWTFHDLDLYLFSK